MLTVKEIKDAIAVLPESEFAELRRWLSEKDWEQWDGQIAQDSTLGKLDFLMEEAREEKARGTLRDL